MHQLVQNHFFPFPPPIETLIFTNGGLGENSNICSLSFHSNIFIVILANHKHGSGFRTGVVKWLHTLTSHPKLGEPEGFH